jgi:hypothetical protein
MMSPRTSRLPAISNRPPSPLRLYWLERGRRPRSSRYKIQCILCASLTQYYSGAWFSSQAPHTVCILSLLSEYYGGSGPLAAR